VVLITCRPGIADTMVGRMAGRDSHTTNPAVAPVSETAAEGTASGETLRYLPTIPSCTFPAAGDGTHVALSRA